MNVRRLVPPLADILLAALLVAFITAVTRHIDASGSDPDVRAVDAGAYACIAVAGGVLAFRRRLPLTVVGIVTAALLGYLIRGYAGGPIFVTIWLALFTVATIRSRPVAFGAAVTASTVLFIAGLLDDSGPNPLLHLVFLAWALVAVLVGDAVRSRRERMEATAERARHLERTREEETRREVAEERLRIARDLHDSVAHTLATINVHAGVAAHVIERRPEEARSSLKVIEQASHEVLDELTAMLRLLRLEGGGPDGDGATRAPTPDLRQLDALVASVRRTGVDVVTDVDATQVSQPVSVAAYRIVQESLTNVIRHAGTPVRVQVTVAPHGDRGLLVEIADNGRATAATGHAGSGMGLVGMRERAQASGGHVEAGPGPAGGWRVRAEWPVR